DFQIKILLPRDYYDRLALQKMSRGLIHKISRDIEIIYEEYNAELPPVIVVYISDYLRGKSKKAPQGITQITRQILLSGILPLWEASSEGEKKWPLYKERFLSKPVILAQGGF